MLDNETGLFYIDKEIINFTIMESSCLEVFIKYKDRVVTYKDLLTEIYRESELTNNTRNKVEIIVYRTFKKLRKYYKLKRIRNLGYYLEGYDYAYKS